jgi:hypothetical protein
MTSRQEPRSWRWWALRVLVAIIALIVLPIAVLAGWVLWQQYRAHACGAPVSLEAAVDAATARFLDFELGTPVSSRPADDQTLRKLATNRELCKVMKAYFTNEEIEKHGEDLTQVECRYGPSWRYEGKVYIVTRCGFPVFSYGFSDLNN